MNKDRESEASVGEKLRHYVSSRQERRSVILLLMAFCGGAVILSVALLERAPSRKAFPLLVGAWGLFGLSMLTGMTTLLAMLAASIGHQRRLDVSRLEPHQDHGRVKFPPHSGALYEVLGRDLFMAVLTILASLALTAFAVINLAP